MWVSDNIDALTDLRHTLREFELRKRKGIIDIHQFALGRG